MPMCMLLDCHLTCFVFRAVFCFYNYLSMLKSYISRFFDVLKRHLDCVGIFWRELAVVLSRFRRYVYLWNGWRVRLRSDRYFSFLCGSGSLNILSWNDNAWFCPSRGSDIVLNSKVCCFCAKLIDKYYNRIDCPPLYRKKKQKIVKNHDLGPLFAPELIDF